MMSAGELGGLKMMDLIDTNDPQMLGEVTLWHGHPTFNNTPTWLMH